MRHPAAAAPRPPRAQPPADPVLTPDHPLPGMPPPSQPARAPRAAQPPRCQPPLDHARITVYRDHRCLRAPRAALPAPRPREDGRAAAYPNLITVASHTKKDNPAGLPSRPSSPPTAPGSPYVLTGNAAGQGLARGTAGQPRAAARAVPRPWRRKIGRAEPASSQTRLKIRWSRRRDSVDHHALPLDSGPSLQLTSQASDTSTQLDCNLHAPSVSRWWEYVVKGQASHGVSGCGRGAACSSEVVTVSDDIELEIGAGSGDGDYVVRVLRAAAGGEPIGVAGARRGRGAGQARPAGGDGTGVCCGHRSVSVAEQPVREVGQQLFQALFTDPCMAYTGRVWGWRSSGAGGCGWYCD